MNEHQKIVFSKTMERADWRNTKIVNMNFIEEIQTLKQQAGNDLVILGSGMLVAE